LRTRKLKSKLKRNGYANVKLASGVNEEMNLKRKAPAFTGAECWRALSKTAFLRPEATAN
jgi:hypothetical protein